MGIEQHKPNTYVYIDGFNLYYGCFKNRRGPQWTQYKWLDLQALCDKLLPKNNVTTIKYYTAEVSSRPPDKQADRQRAYLKALSTLDRVSIIKGHFLGPRPVKMPECDEQGKYLGRSVYVLKTEEKGSDVNLAVDMLYDCVRDSYDCAVVISNDSDLIAPIQIVRSEYKKIIGWVNPHTQNSRHLRENIDFQRKITLSILEQSQLPNNIDIGEGRSISKPSEW